MDVLKKYQGESEKLIRNIFEQARKRKPSIIFIDEIDSILNSNFIGSDSLPRIKSELCIQMDRISDSNEIFIIAATNQPYDICDAIMRRFDQIIYVPLPNKTARSNMFRRWFIKEMFSDEHLEELAIMSNGYILLK